MSESQNLDGVRIVGFPHGRSRIKRFFLTNYELFRAALREGADIHHFHDLDFVPWAVLLKLIGRTKVIYDIHEAHPEYMLLKEYIPRPLRRFLSFGIWLLEHIAVRFFDAIVPNDNFIAQGFRHRRNVTIFNFPTLDFFKNVQNTPWESRKYDLFYHGSLPKYHVERMMAIASELNLAGVTNLWGLVTNDRETVRWALSEAQRHGLSGNFEFLPYTDYLRVVDYLNQARIGIIPLPPYAKFMKNIPLKMFEFMGCGIPMVLSDLPPSGQFLRNINCAIAVEPDNIQAYASAIKKLLQSPTEAERMGRNGARAVAERFSWQMEERKLLELYQDLAVTCLP
jgi:glycosyltransferase involved in cell wall biosynthesis